MCPRRSAVHNGLRLEILLSNVSRIRAMPYTLFQNLSQLQFEGNCVGVFGARIVRLKFKMLLEDWIGLKSKHFLAGNELAEVDRFSHLISCITLGDPIADEVSPGLKVARLACTKFRHL